MNSQAGPRAAWRAGLEDMPRALLAMIERCCLCPRRCGKDRLSGETGFCKAGPLPRAALASLHHWEEPCISGTRGSGTVFFSHCNLRCVFCQNHDLSHEGVGRDMAISELADAFLRLMGKGAHNINLVTPSHYLPQVTWAISIARGRGLSIPVVYNSNAYENPEALGHLEGLVDVYLPDLKYHGQYPAERYSSAPDYFAAATQAILEMHRQVGSSVFSEEGIMTRGLLIRHLVLPGHVDDSKRVLDWVRSHLPADTYLSIMSQYVPMHAASRYPEINRRLTHAEYDEVLDYSDALGLENGFVQDTSSQDTSFIPRFDSSGLDRPN